MVRVIMMGMIVVFVVIALREGPAHHNIIGVAARPCGRLKFLGIVDQCLFPISRSNGKLARTRKGASRKRIISLFKPHLPAPTSLPELHILPVSLNDAIDLPNFLVNRDQCKNTILVAN